MSEPSLQSASPTRDHDLLADHILLVGAGVVGRAIAADHLRAGIEVWLADQNEDVLRASCDLVLAASDAIADSASPWGARIPLPVVHLSPLPSDHVRQSVGPNWLLIESIAERLDAKQAFFAEAEQWFDRGAVLTTNTSTLLVGSIAAKMQHPERLCGLHFFMPVVDRHAVEVIPHELETLDTASRTRHRTHPEVTEACVQHAHRLGKTPLLVRDSPGFVVNRLLAPYLNLAIDLLCGGVDADTIRRAALRYGMPMSPLELIDLIGTRTAFDGGRVVWSAFPGRMDPSPLLPALVKRKLAGVASGQGFYQYDRQGVRVSDGLSPQVYELIASYHHERFASLPVATEPRIDLVAELFAATIRSEAIAIECDCVCDMATLDAAMCGGLGWTAQSTLLNHCKGPIECLTFERAMQLANQFPHLKSIV